MTSWGRLAAASRRARRSSTPAFTTAEVSSTYLYVVIASPIDSTPKGTKKTRGATWAPIKIGNND